MGLSKFPTTQSIHLAWIKYESNFALNIGLFLFPTSLYKNHFQESHIKNVFSAIFKQHLKLIFKVMSEFVNDMEMVNNVMSEQSK